jgi:hypothetical protein
MNKKTRKNKGGQNTFLQHLSKMYNDSQYKQSFLQKYKDYKTNQEIVENINKTPSYKSDCEKIINSDYNHLSDNEIDMLFILCNTFNLDKTLMKLYSNMSLKQKKKVFKHVNKKDHNWEFASTISFVLYSEKNLDEDLINSMCIFLLALPKKKQVFYINKFYDNNNESSSDKTEDYTGTDEYTDINDFDVSSITFEYLSNALKMSEKKQTHKRKPKLR